MKNLAYSPILQVYLHTHTQAWDLVTVKKSQLKVKTHCDSTSNVPVSKTYFIKIFVFCIYLKYFDIFQGAFSQISKENIHLQYYRIADKRLIKPENISENHLQIPLLFSFNNKKKFS